MSVRDRVNEKQFLSACIANHNNNSDATIFKLSLFSKGLAKYLKYLQFYSYGQNAV